MPVGHGPAQCTPCWWTINSSLAGEQVLWYFQASLASVCRSVAARSSRGGGGGAKQHCSQAHRAPRARRPRPCAPTHGDAARDAGHEDASSFARLYGPLSAPCAIPSSLCHVRHETVLRNHDCARDAVCLMRAGTAVAEHRRHAPARRVPPQGGLLPPPADPLAPRAAVLRRAALHEHFVHSRRSTRRQASRANDSAAAHTCAQGGRLVIAHRVLVVTSIILFFRAFCVSVTNLPDMSPHCQASIRRPCNHDSQLYIVHHTPSRITHGRLLLVMPHVTMSLSSRRLTSPRRPFVFQTSFFFTSKCCRP